MRVTVVGGGVIGRTAAFLLQSSGHEVTLITDKRHEDTTSAVAGGLWKPVYAEPRDLLIKWAHETYDWFKSIPTQAEANNGLQWTPALFHLTDEDEDLSWASVVPDLRSVVTPPNLPSQIIGTMKATLPILDMPRFFPWLIKESEAVGVREIFKRVHSIDEAREYGEIVVLATGLETNYLVPDAALYPIQGQIVRVKNPGDVPYQHYGFEDITLYIIPRVDDVVIGGTHVMYESSTEVNKKLQQEMLLRAVQFEPRLAGQDIVSTVTGLRPGRALVRVDRENDVIHAYGHGGSGITVSWGVAREILKLVENV